MIEIGATRKPRQNVIDSNFSENARFHRFPLNFQVLAGSKSVVLYYFPGDRSGIARANKV